MSCMLEPSTCQAQSASRATRKTPGAGGSSRIRRARVVQVPQGRERGETRSKRNYMGER